MPFGLLPLPEDAIITYDGDLVGGLQQYAAPSERQRRVEHFYDGMASTTSLGKPEDTYRFSGRLLSADTGQRSIFADYRTAVVGGKALVILDDGTNGTSQMVYVTQAERGGPNPQEGPTVSFAFAPAGADVVNVGAGPG